MKDSTRYQELWTRYEANTRSLNSEEFQEMCRLSPYSQQDGPDKCPECGRREYLCCCGYFAMLEKEA
jgi:hypothetical protein